MVKVPMLLFILITPPLVAVLSLKVPLNTTLPRELPITEITPPEVALLSLKVPLKTTLAPLFTLPLKQIIPPSRATLLFSKVPANSTFPLRFLK